MPVGAGFIPARIGENKKMTEHKKLQPEIRFAGFTDDWEQCKAEDVFISISEKNHETFPVLSATQDKGMISRNEVGIDIKYDVNSLKTYKLVRKDQFVIHLRSFQGGFAHSAIDGITSPAYTILDFKDKRIHSPLFWREIFKSDFFIKRLESVIYGIRDGRSISYDEFLKLNFNYPSFEEQTQIGNFFKQLDDTIALHQRTLEKYQKLKVSYLEKMFPKENEQYPELRFPNFTDAWEQRKLGEVVEFFSGLTYSPTDVLNNGTLVLRSSNIQDSQIVTDDNVYVRPECVYSQNVEIGDIVVVVRNGSKNLIGKHALVSKQMNNTVIGAFMTGIRSNNPSFFNALLDTSKFNDEIEKNLGATINQITTGAFKSMEFLIPSYEEQTQIGNFFKQLDDTIALHQREVEKYKKIKQSYLEKMFI